LGPIIGTFFSSARLLKRRFEHDTSTMFFASVVPRPDTYTAMARRYSHPPYKYGALHDPGSALSILAWFTIVLVLAYANQIWDRFSPARLTGPGAAADAYRAAHGDVWSGISSRRHFRRRNK